MDEIGALQKKVALPELKWEDRTVLRDSNFLLVHRGGGGWFRPTVVKLGDSDQVFAASIPNVVTAGVWNSLQGYFCSCAH